ncbi:GNAT family N-acetyltransferase [Frondihabitans sucicola]|nr:GNAT family N-acetyltransferase [Frondihabitans sucicola]
MDPSRLSPVDTPRMILTPIGAGDVRDLLVLYSDPIVARWTGPWTEGATRRWARSMVDRWQSDGVAKWMARDRATGALIGRGGPTRLDLEGETVVEIGWVIRDALTGLGYATEMGLAAVEWTARFEPQLPVVSFTEVHNRASRAVMTRLGMEFERIIVREGLVEGREGLQADAPFALYRLPTRQPRMVTPG